MEAHLIDIDYREEKEGTDIVLYCRTAEGKKVFLERFEPYFYVLPDRDIKESIDQLSGVKRVESVTKQIHGKKASLLKIFTTYPSQIYPLRDELRKSVPAIYEADILITRRYLLDKGITPFTQMDISVEGDRITKIIPTETFFTPRVLALDIETYSKSMDPKEPILMVALYGADLQKVFTWKPFTEENTQCCNDEKAMITAMIEAIKAYDPDVITGYYSDGFDFPYLLTRAKELKMNLDFGYGNIHLGKGNEPVAYIPGFSHIDLLKLVKRTVGRNLETSQYRLQDVAQEVLGEGKHEVDLAELSVAWDANDGLDVFAKYNLQDTKLTYELFHKLYPQLLEMTRFVALTPFDVSRMAFSQLVEWFIIHRAKAFDEVIQPKPENEEIAKRKYARLKGAFVFEPTPGLYHDILVFDFMSLYPTIITAHNLSPSSLCEGKKEEGYVNPDDDSIWFSKEPGFLSTILREVIEQRLDVKKQLKKNPDDKFLQARVQTLKLLANSFYGYLGFYAARWYCFPAAETTTALGRHYIKKVIAAFGEKKIKVIYSDTDSVFIKLDKHKKEEALAIVASINEDLPGLMDLEYEGHYPSGIFVSMKASVGGAKKRYALVDDAGKMKITGFEMVRRNVSPIAKRVQEEVLNIILKEADKEKALTYVQGFIDKLRKKEISNEEVTILTRISKDLESYDNVGPHVAVAQRLVEAGEKIGSGSIIRFIIAEGPGKIRDKAKTPSEVKEGSYDAEYYINNQVLPAVEKIFEVMGYSKEELLGEARQKSLDSFFG